MKRTMRGARGFSIGGGRDRRPLPVWLFVAYLVLAGILISQSKAQEAEGSQVSPAERARAAADALQKWYAPETGLYRTTGWWNSANAITALANYSRLSGSGEYRSVFANTLRVAPSAPDGGAGFLNKYYDDEGWWALAWIDVYDLTGEPHYLAMAKEIFADMQQGWDSTVCGGGVWWSKNRRDKNAIENELFLAVAASLANRVRDRAERRDALAWARREWHWFRASGMIDASDLINDGLDLSSPRACRNNGKRTWTYNQGVIVGALLELHRADPKEDVIPVANRIAVAAIRMLTDGKGILQEPEGAHTGADVPQFKGIFARNLMLLDSASPDARFRVFLWRNANSVWENDRDSEDHFGFWWQGPFDQADAARQSSALDLLNAAWEASRAR